MGRKVTVSSIKARYTGADPDKKYLLKEFDAFINKKAKLVEKEITASTIQNACFQEIGMSYFEK